MKRNSDDPIWLAVIAQDRLKGADVFGAPSLGQCYYGDCYADWDCSEGCSRDRKARELDAQHRARKAAEKAFK